LAHEEFKLTLHFSR